jgi:RNA polymerase sigma-70 factor (ECF subfamily)
VRFPSTDWPLVIASRTPSASQPASLSELCRRYWSPVYAYLRRRGYRAADAEDLTQSFFVHLLAKGVLTRATPERGHLRTLLLTCLTNFVANESTRRRAIKRGGGGEPGRERDRPYLVLEPADDMTPERIYELQWVMVLLGRVLDDLREELAAARKEHVFDALKGFLIGDGAAPDAGYREAAAALNITEAAARVAVHRLRRRYRELLWQEVAGTVQGMRDVAGEINYLLAVVQDRPAGARLA